MSIGATIGMLVVIMVLWLHGFACGYSVGDKRKP